MSAADPSEPEPPGKGNDPAFTRAAASGTAAPSPAAQGMLHAELLSRIWRQSLPLMRQRMLTLEQAAQEARRAPLSAAARTDAADLAHKLAGSLGMFGYPLGTEIARAMEQMLEADGALDGAQFSEAVARLRSALPLDND